jgi:hypothetical protein
VTRTRDPIITNLADRVTYIYIFHILHFTLSHHFAATHGQPKVRSHRFLGVGC